MRRDSPQTSDKTSLIAGRIRGMRGLEVFYVALDETIVEASNYTEQGEENKVEALRGRRR